MFVCGGCGAAMDSPSSAFVQGACGANLCPGCIAQAMGVRPRAVVATPPEPSRVFARGTPPATNHNREFERALARLDERSRRDRGR